MSAAGRLYVDLVDADDDELVEDLVATIERHPAASGVGWLDLPEERRHPTGSDLEERARALADQARPRAQTWQERRRRRDTDD